MLNAAQGVPFEALAQDAPPGLVGTITVEVYDPTDASVLIAPMTAGISEPAPGTYRVELTVSELGSFMIRWTVPGDTAEEELYVGLARPPAPPAPGTDTPNLAGFADAQQRLRDELGEPVVFLFPEQLEWAPEVALDPETGRPYDPMTEPAGRVEPSATIDNCDVAIRAADEDVRFSALGFTEAEDVLVICSSGQASAASGAESAVVRSERYMVMAQRFDGIGEIQRYLTALRRRGTRSDHP